MNRFWLLVALLWPLIAGAQPVILPPGAEGLDLSRYDAKNRAPRFIVSGGQLQLHPPKVQPDLMPRTLVKANFRYVGSSSLGVRLEDGTSQEYYCPGRLSKALSSIARYEPPAIGSNEPPLFDSRALWSVRFLGGSSVSFYMHNKALTPTRG